MRNIRTVRIVASGALVLASVILGLGVMVPAIGNLMLIRSEDATPNELSRSETWQVATGGPLMGRRSFLKIRYPKAMRENETRIVELTYTVQSVEVGERLKKPTVSDVAALPQEMESLDADVQIHLGSSGFKLEPNSDITESSGAALPIVRKWTITPEGEGYRSLLLRVEEKNIAGRSFLQKYGYAGPLSTITSINGVPTDAMRNGFVELPVNVYTYWGVSRLTASLVGAAIALLGFFLGWPVFVSALTDRRSIACTVHIGSFPNDRRQYAFIRVVNRSRKEEIEITHVWFATKPRVDVLNRERPLPRRLRPNDSWETWIDIAKLPTHDRSSLYTKALVRLSSGPDVRSERPTDVPTAGHVAGG